MSWQVIVALVVAVPVLLLPIVFVWILNAGAMLAEIRERKLRKEAEKRAAMLSEATNGVETAEK